MATKVQAKTYFPGSSMDLNNGLCNALWDLYRDDRTSASEKSQFYDSFLMRQTMDGYAKEQMRQTILKQESIFRHQLQELHRLYERQRDLMNELRVREHYNFPMPAEAPKPSQFQSQVPSRISKEINSPISNFPQMDSTFHQVSISENNSIFAPPNFFKGKCALKEFGPLSPNCSTTQRRVIDLELPADGFDDTDGKQPVKNVHKLSTKRAYNLADLNEPIQVEEASFAASVSNKNSDKKKDLSANSNMGSWLLSKISEEDIKENEGRIACGDIHIDGERHKKNQISYSFADGKTKFYNNGYDNGIFSRKSNSLQAEPKRKRTIFGVEICARSQTPSFDSSQSSPWDQNTSMLHHNHWLGSDVSKQIVKDFAGNTHVNSSNSRLMTSSGVGFPYQSGGILNGINSKISASGILERPHEKHDVMDGIKNHENLEKKLPPWLIGKSSFNDEIKGKETTLYHMNLDSLQHHSQQFFKKSEMAKVQIDTSKGVTKILGFPIADMPDNLNAETKYRVQENGKINCSSELRHHIDLNLSFDEEEAPSSTPQIPESVVKIATMEINLEAPTVVESETETHPTEIKLDTPSKSPMDVIIMDGHDELVKVAAEAILSISSSELVTTQPPPDTLLRWFAELIASGDSIEKDSANVDNNEESIPEGMDYLEYMTLKLQETKEKYHCDKAMILEEKEEDEGLSRKRTTRKGQGKRGRQRKDFQRDVLPSIVSLSRREVTEDLQTFEEAFCGIGVSWQSSLSKRKAAGKNGRGRRRSVISSPSFHTPSPPPPPPPAVEQSVCREVALEEKSLSGWGKRTRRLPRQRCQNGANHHSLALKC